MRYKVVVRFVIDGDLRFISHHDTMRLFERALSRANLPVKYSEGFNPRPRLSLPVPRPVGIASEADVLVVDLIEPLAPADALQRLGAEMPADLTLTGAWMIEGGPSPRPTAITCHLELPASCHSAVAESLAGFQAAVSWPVDRRKPSGRSVRTLDLREGVIASSLSQGRLEWTTRIAEGGSVRPGEFLTAMGLSAEEWLHRVRRKVMLDSDPSGPGPASPPGDGTSS